MLSLSLPYLFTMVTTWVQKSNRVTEYIESNIDAFLTLLQVFMVTTKPRRVTFHTLLYTSWSRGEVAPLTDNRKSSTPNVIWMVIGCKNKHYDKLSLQFITREPPRVNEESKILIKYKQDSIPVGCVPPACQPYVFWWPPLDVSKGAGGVGHQVDKFEQVSSDGHQMSVVGWEGVGAQV